MFDRTILDDDSIYKKLDPDGMLNRIQEFPDQIETSWNAATSIELPATYRDINKVVILGMGGSAIGGDLLKSLILPEARLPVIIHRDYNLPFFIDDKTLVIASSYSGQTEETLSAFKEALHTNSKKLVITTGGKLKELALQNDIPVFLFNYNSQPRAALGYSFGYLAGIFHTLGIIADKKDEIRETILNVRNVISKVDVIVPYENNTAKQLAAEIMERIVIIYGAGILSEVAHRWKTQLNENSKTWAFYEVFPELNHNAIVGYEFPKDLAGKVFIVMLRTNAIHKRILKRYELVTSIIENAGINYMLIDAEGNSLLSQMMSLLVFGDYVSFYLAILYGTDPSPVNVIQYLKGQMSS